MYWKGPGSLDGHVHVGFLNLPVEDDKLLMLGQEVSLSMPITSASDKRSDQDKRVLSGVGCQTNKEREVYYLV